VARSVDPLTRHVRDAANAAAVAVVAYAMLWLVTTQVRSVREVSPFADDPYDLVASYAAIFLPLVAGATWIRSLAHRGPVLPRTVASRITLGSGIAVAIVGAAVAADTVAMLVTPGWADSADPAAVLIAALVAVAGAATAVAAALLLRTVAASRRPRSVEYDTATEPDVVDDALGLAVEVGARVRLGEAARRASLAVERFLERSRVSPRRHRIGFGIALALVGGLAFVLWHAVREGPWATPAAALVFGSLAAVGILAIYLVTLGPLRLLRPAPD
jgi:hypothetical protein